MADASLAAPWVPVLTFHTISDQPSNITWPARAFFQAMSTLHEHGFRAIALTDALSYLQRGAGFPKRSFVVTFDDGYEAMYLKAFPVLQELRMPATVFPVVAGGGRSAGDRLPSLNAHPMLTWGQIYEMARCGVTFGAHTLTHPDLTRVPPEQVEAELSSSQAILQDALGTCVDTFAYPYGAYNRQVQEVARQHFALALTDGADLLHTGSDPYAAERVDAHYLRDSWQFELILPGLFPWYLHGRRALNRVRRRLLPPALLPQAKT